MKSTLFGAAMIVSAGTFAAAHAADIYQGGGTKDGSAYLPAITWTGFYLGAHVGGSFGDGIKFSGTKDESQGFSIGNGGVVGLHIGYNWQSANNVVLGVEGDYTWGGGDDEVGGILATDAIASIRGRLGYALGATMVYATGGVALLNWSDQFEVTAFDGRVLGWVAGAGVEHKLMNNISLGLEGLYYAFDDEATLGFSDNDLLKQGYDRDFWAVRARLSYHFASGHEEPLK